MVKRSEKTNKIKVKTLSESMVIDGLKNIITENRIEIGGLIDEKEALNDLLVSRETKIKILEQKIKIDFWVIGGLSLIGGILLGIIIF